MLLSEPIRPTFMQDMVSLQLRFLHVEIGSLLDAAIPNKTQNKSLKRLLAAKFLVMAKEVQGYVKEEDRCPGINILVENLHRQS